MRHFKVILAEALALGKKKQDSRLNFAIFDVYYAVVLSSFWKQHQSLCNSKN